MNSILSQPQSHEGLLFHRLRWQMFRNAARAVLGQSMVRPITIVLCSLVVWVFVFSLSYSGFRFVAEKQVPLGGDIVGIVFDLMFLTLGVMLIFSTGLILHGSLFAQAETAFLLSKPIRADRVFAYKFQGAVAFSSWAFLILGGPVLIAYGLVCAAPLAFYGFLLAFFIGYVLLPGSIGAFCCLLIVNFVPRRRKEALAALVMGTGLVIGLGIYQSVRWARSMRTSYGDREAVHQLLGRFNFARGALMPNHWVGAGLRAAGRGDLAEAGSNLALVWSNGLLCYLLAALASVPLYRRGFNRIATGGDLRRRFGGHRLDKLLDSLMPFVNPKTRLLIVKDFRTFRRDPQQWAQVLILSTLMVLYVMNIRRMFVGDIGWIYKNGVSMLNLSAVSLLLCTYTGRFIYPMLSLEGRKFWILGLLPLQREQLLWGKFTFSTVGTLPPALGLVLLSDLMLGMPASIILLHAATVMVLAVGLSAISVGLGACLPNFRETDPSKIAVGFGGTLNLVLCLSYLLLVIILMSGTWHASMALRKPEDGLTPGGIIFVAMGLLLGAACTLVAVFVPLRLGLRSLRKMEF